MIWDGSNVLLVSVSMCTRAACSKKKDRFINDDNSRRSSLHEIRTYREHHMRRL